MRTRRVGSEPGEGLEARGDRARRPEGGLNFRPQLRRRTRRSPSLPWSFSPFVPWSVGLGETNETATVPECFEPLGGGVESVAR